MKWITAVFAQILANMLSIVHNNDGHETPLAADNIVK